MLYVSQSQHHMTYKESRKTMLYIVNLPILLTLLIIEI